MKLQIPLRDFQTEGVAFAASKRYSLNGFQMGLGKSAQALALACQVDAPKTLVLCPAFLKLNWRAEITKFLGADALGRFDIVSHDSIYKVQDFKPYGYVIADEVHAYKSMDSKRSKALHQKLAADPPAYFLGLSGTPVLNNCGEFYSLLRACWYGGRYPEFDRYSGSQWFFQREFMIEQRLKFGGRKFTKWSGVKNPEALRDLIRPVYIRKKTADVLSLPPRVQQEVVVAERSAHDAALEAAWESYQGGKADKKNFSSGKAVNALSKVPYTVELAKDILAGGDSVIIFTDHIQSAEALAAVLPGSACITGEGVPAAQRQAFVDRMNSGSLKILIATIPSLSVGFNLTGCNRVIFNDYPWVPAMLDQAEGRVFRYGQTRTTFFYYVLASKMDQYIFKTLSAKRDVIAEVVGT